MPHVSSSGGDDLASSDEVKVYKDEGDDEKRSSENLSEDKLGLVSESEARKSSSDRGNEKPSTFDEARIFSHLFPRPLFGYPFFAPYPYSNGATLPVVGSKVLPTPPNPFFPLYSGDIAQPPPAHMGIPAVPFDTKRSLLSSPLLACTTPPLPYPPLYPPDFTPWPTPPGYPLNSGPFGGPYASPLGGFNSGLLNMVPPGVSHPTLVAQTGGQEPLSPITDNRHCERRGMSEPPHEKRRPYVKKPLNAFMLFMKEMRQKVIEESTLKESAAINQILGRKWHELNRSEQTRYYEMARKEKELHAKSFPNWSARDNYGLHSKRKKKREVTCQHIADKDCPSAKKCRARFGLDQQSQWCKPCRRKKRCIRFKREDGDPGNGSDLEDDDDNDDDDDDDDGNSRSIHTLGSTTDGDNRPSSPLSFGDENSNEPHQHSGASNNDSSSQYVNFSHRSLASPGMDTAKSMKFPRFDLPKMNGGIPSTSPSLPQSGGGLMQANGCVTVLPSGGNAALSQVGCVT